MRAREVLTVIIALAILSVSVAAFAVEVSLDESPAAPGRWGYRPAEGTVSMRTPPPFSWRPQADAAGYALQVARDADFADVVYEADGIEFHVHCPSEAFAPGRYHWRFRYADADGSASPWSRSRAFTIAADAVAFPLPPRAELLARIPDQHPRLFLRPEDLPRLRDLAEGRLADQYAELVAACDKLMADPPASSEPPKYPADLDRGKNPAKWKEIWWGNRLYTIELLNGAATLGFTYRLSGHEPYGQQARKLLMAAAAWDPKGSTCMEYNDEAAIPYNYYFSRTYSYVNDLLSETERETCRRIMTIRGREMYERLHPGHLWDPHGSHNNRSWHFLGEIAIAFHGEIAEADDWLWFAMNVFANVYPVWCDHDGGWHEGMSYWRSYINRFTWWAVAMRAAVGIDAFKLPYFSKAGYYAMYLQSPGDLAAAGFGDLNAWRQHPWRNGELMTTLAAQAGNPYWKWYADAIGGADAADRADPRNHNTGAPLYIGFVRGALPEVKARFPGDLPSSRVFRGVGLAMLNTDITDASRNVKVIFKASPFGTRSHGYESNNSFILYAFGERLFIRSGQRDKYASPHHKEWMWQTRSTNCITVNGAGQFAHSSDAQGEITGFHTSDAIDFVRGEASRSYPQHVERFTRSIVFIKPDLIVIHDLLEAATPSTFEWLLHALVPMTVNGAADISVTGERAACHAAILAPTNLKVTTTDQFDPPPKLEDELIQYHLTATTGEPAREACFVTVLRPYRAGAAPEASAELSPVEGGYLLRANTSRGQAVILLRREGSEPLAGAGWRMTGDLAVAIEPGDGQAAETFATGGELTRE